MDAYEAYWFIYNHPRCIVIEPSHPLVDFSQYEHLGFGEDHFLAHAGKPQDAEYTRGREEWADFEAWRGQFINNLSFDYVKVNPKTNSIDDDKSKNTDIRVWLETGPAYWENFSGRYRENMHDPALDCSGKTFEDALILLAFLIKEKYGDYVQDNH